MIRNGNGFVRNDRDAQLLFRTSIERCERCKLASAPSATQSAATDNL